MLLFATDVGSSVAASHFGNDCNSMIKSLNQNCITEGYQQLGCSSYGGQSNTAAACNRCSGCSNYAKTCLRVNLISTHASSSLGYSYKYDTADNGTDNFLCRTMKAIRWYLTILMIATLVEISVAQSHFGSNCNNMIRSLNQQCASKGYKKYRCLKYGGQSDTTAACAKCPKCTKYAKSCLRVNLESARPVNQCSNAKTMARSLRRQGY
ncbi:hypothetical protein PHET_02758 [Paragonimus heterotremus]|uniref:Uncharacterized protein n=1 Tax=Paragonimus heterotremus TaxID=100268 RepID=A0A8J4TCM1_9TREM|nr:hypothetical protein PHET_02758 [Paragonimus heterotremus]